MTTRPQQTRLFSDDVEPDMPAKPPQLAQDAPNDTTLCHTTMDRTEAENTSDRDRQSYAALEAFVGGWK